MSPLPILHYHPHTFVDDALLFRDVSPRLRPGIGTSQQRHCVVAVAEALDADTVLLQRGSVDVMGAVGEQVDFELLLCFQVGWRVDVLACDSIQDVVDYDGALRVPNEDHLRLALVKCLFHRPQNNPYRLHLPPPHQLELPCDAFQEVHDEGVSRVVNNSDRASEQLYEPLGVLHSDGHTSPHSVDVYPRFIGMTIIFRLNKFRRAALSKQQPRDEVTKVLAAPIRWITRNCWHQCLKHTQQPISHARLQQGLDHAHPRQRPTCLSHQQ
mmetsp:Transcript_17910/g.50954  ORF Transcript_17910/g.50954 Transcript_17910/m.50954 type:complete len:269 (+) Transcript_17910:1032-1838(+)